VSRPTGTGPGVWICLGVGWAVIGYALAGIVENSESTMPLTLGTWLVGGNVLHDLLAAPIIFVTGWVIARLVPTSLRRAVVVGMALSATVVLVGVIPLRGYGDRPANPTLQPLDYRSSVLSALGIAWAVAAAVAAFDVWNRRHRAGAAR
jgi:hypothetical protein